MSVQAIAWVLENSKSQGSTRCVLLSIANHVGADGEGWAYVQQVMAEANCSEDTYRRAVQWAVDHGELVREVNRGAARKAAVNRRPNHFRLTMMASATCAPRKMQPPADCRGQETQDAAPKDAPPEPSRSLEPSKEPSQNPDSDFDAFWSVYPLRKAKRAAAKAWVQARKRAPAETIIAGARRYAESRRTQDPTFTAHPATWLNADRWDDEVDTPRRESMMGSGPRTAEVVPL